MFLTSSTRPWLMISSQFSVSFSVDTIWLANAIFLVYRFSSVYSRHNLLTMIDLNEKSELNLLPSQENESKHVSKKKR